MGPLNLSASPSPADPDSAALRPETLALLYQRASEAGRSPDDLLQRLLGQPASPIDPGSLLDQMADPVALFDRDIRYRYDNTALASRLGLDPAALIGRTDAELGLPLELREHLAAACHQVFQTGENLRVEFEFGSAFYEVQIKPVLCKEAEVEYVLALSRDITARRQAELALRESKQRFDDLVQNLPALVYRLRMSPEGGFHFDYLSPKCEEYTGVSAEEGMRDASLIHAGFAPADFARHNELTLESAGTLQPFVWEGPMSIHGQPRWIRLESRPNRQPDGDVVWDGLHLDITARHLMEKQLREQHDQLDHFFSASLDLLCIASTDGYFVRVNREWENRLGYSAEDLEGHRFLDFVHPEDIAATLEALSVLETGAPVLNFINRYRARDGSYRYIEWRSQPHGRLIYATARDITERMQMEAALRESEGRQRALLQAIPDIVFREDQNGVLLDYHARSLEDLELPPGQFLGRHIEEILPEQAPLHLEALRRALAEGREVVYEYETAIRGALCSFEARMVPAGPDEVITIIRNVSETRQAQRRAFELALERERRKLLTGFVADITHEFRTPLSILNNIVYLIPRLEDPVKRDRHLEQLSIQVKRMSRLVAMMAMMIGLEHSDNAHDFTQVHLGPVLRQTCEQASLAHGPHPLLHCEIDQALPPVLGIQAYLREVVLELLNNAYHFTPPEGEISLRAFLHGDRVVVELRDTGRGIAPDQLPHIFEAFWRSEHQRSTPGLGLGLAMVSRIVDLHRGEIAVESQPGQGTLLRISLPASSG